MKKVVEVMSLFLRESVQPRTAKEIVFRGPHRALERTVETEEEIAKVVQTSRMSAFNASWKRAWKLYTVCRDGGPGHSTNTGRGAERSSGLTHPDSWPLQASVSS